EHVVTLTDTTTGTSRRLNHYLLKTVEYSHSDLSQLRLGFDKHTLRSYVYPHECGSQGGRAEGDARAAPSHPAGAGSPAGRHAELHPGPGSRDAQPRAEAPPGAHGAVPVRLRGPLPGGYDRPGRPSRSGARP